MTWNKITNFNNRGNLNQQHLKFDSVMKNLEFMAQAGISHKVFVKSVVIRGINDSNEELHDFLEYCSLYGFHPKFFEFEPQYPEQEQYVVGRKELFAKLEDLGCRFSDDAPRHNNKQTYIPSVNFEYKTEIGTPKGLHSIFGCGDEGACKSCYINLPIFIKPHEDGNGLYIKPCSPIETRFDLTQALRTNNEKQILDIIRMSREYLMLMPGLGINKWNKEENFNIDF